jgi:signal transduction histidine kinase/ligand-binding sensor domain-containing protein
VTEGRDVRFTRLSTRDGLSQTRVLQIAQDDRGFLWFGTQYGLNRYDGYRFKLFKHVLEDPDSLSSVYVYALYKDRAGTLWVGGEEFLDRFDPETETFAHFALNSENPPTLPAPVVHISEDREGRLWLATGRGLVRFDPANGRMTRYRHRPSDPDGLGSDDIKSTGEDSVRTLWVAAGNSLEALDPETGNVTRRVTLDEPVRELSFHEDRFGVFWIFYNPNGGDGGLATLDRETGALTRYGLEALGPGPGLTGVYDVLETSDGTLWLATMGSGLLELDASRQRFVRYRNDPADVESLAEDRAIVLFEDREGNIWTGLHAKEPNYFSDRRPLFERVAPERHDPESLGETIVNGIYVDDDGVLWLGTSGALGRVEIQGRQYRFYRSPGPSNTNDVLTIAEDRNGTLWVGALSGLHRFDRVAGWVKSYRHDPADPGSLSHDIVTRLLVDRKGTLWAATFGGLNRFDPERDGFIVYQTGSHSSLAEGPDGELWLGSNTSGLQRFDPTTGRVSLFQHEASDVRTLSDNRVNAVLVDRAGTVWIGTQNGLNRFDREDETFALFDERHGLPANAVSCILEDDRGDLWMSTNRGLSHFDAAEETFRNFTVADGLPGADLTGWGTCHRSSRGEMFFGGFSGAVSFHPDAVRESAYVPPVVLTDFRLSGHPVDVGGESPLHESITYADGIRLSHRQNIFSLEFSALGFTSPSTNRYRYMLEGLESSWNEVPADRRVVSYTTLPAGEYRFRVQGATARGPWSEPGASLLIEILPPWWRTWWFTAICAAALVVSARAAYRYRLRQMAQRFSERLEERLDERTRIARELHDTLLQGFISASMQLHVAADQLPAQSPAKAQVDRVLSLMTRVIEEGRNVVRGLRSSSDDPSDLEGALSRIHDEYAAQSHVDYRITIEGRPRPLNPLVRDEVYRIGREAVVNAFRHSAARSIEVALEYSSDRLRMCVRDDGRGIDPEVVSEGSRGHWGLSGMRERAERIGAGFKVRTRADAGTEVELSIPAAVAFHRRPSRRRPSWLESLSRRRTTDGDD